MVHKPNIVKSIIGICILLAIAVSIIELTGISQRQAALAADEAVARENCSFCHAFPEPSLLPKHLWKDRVLPQMAFRMGFDDNNIKYTMSIDEYFLIKKMLPKQPLVSEKDWERIRNYYLANAPDSLASPDHRAAENAPFARSEPQRLPMGGITFLRFDSVTQTIQVADILSSFYTLDKNFNIIDSTRFSSPVTYATRNNGDLVVSLAGKLLPNDKKLGKLIAKGVTPEQFKIILDTVQRPVHFELYDFNADKKDDILLCEFGNYTGALSLYTSSEKVYTRILLSDSPGARKVILKDWNQDSKMDILVLFAQGDERLVLYENEGGASFQPRTLLQFPAVYGSSYFEVVDFNDDNLFDIVYCNGDNGDFTNIVKPYHGIRIFKNMGDEKLEEVCHYPMPGAWKTISRDFDRDGDIDIAAISFFPDNKAADKSFIYLRNKGDYNFEGETLPDKVIGKWMDIDAFDKDEDGDLDLVLGAFDLDKIQEESSRKNPSDTTARLLYLENLSD